MLKCLILCAINRWENRAASLNSEVVVDASAPYVPPLPVNPENPQAWFSVSAQGRSLGVVKLELMVRNRGAALSPCLSQLAQRKSPTAVHAINPSLIAPPPPPPKHVQADRCPLAAENFFRLCETGVYRGSFMHRIVPGCAIQVCFPTAPTCPLHSTPANTFPMRALA